ncbi:hypothetical protein PVK06_011034 [Gossypium arboreum]|uniref:Uncharacterized protein n=1 Tax=Gossypium arboreum TaxID=29729 RepID=A0ABR0Q7Z2_GOSAR|nr:hypothetical protein PVK06_011034 [Gossypium arboreum]
MKWPEEVDKVDAPNYCKYHCLVNHIFEKCLTLKDKILHLYEDGKSKFKEEAVSSHLTLIKMGHKLYSMIKFCSFDPIILTSYGEDNFDAKGLQVDDQSGVPKINFTDVDLLGSTPHNRPLLVIGYICKKKVNKILVDNGSTVNKIHLKTMKNWESLSMS